MTNINLSIHNILCPTDFSELAASAFAESVRLARWFGAKVTVVHVPFTLPIAGDLGHVPEPAEMAEAVRRATLEDLRQFVNATDHRGVPVAIGRREGDACDEIRKSALQIGADLVVMGTHARSGFTRLVLGSVTEAVLNLPPAPVLTVNRRLRRRNGLFRTLLCATDVSEWSAGTMSVALAIAGDGAKRLTVLNVVEHGVAGAEEWLERSALTSIQGLIPEDARSSYRIDERVAIGEPGRKILGVAAEDASDLIVMGTGGRGALGHRFGSTVRRVVRGAACPVLVVPAGHVWPSTGLVRQESMRRSPMRSA